MPPGHQIFLLSPANCAGKRAGFLLRKDARSPLAQRLRSGEGATIGEVFTFMSGLYFRGKLAYATAFASPPEGSVGVQRSEEHTSELQSRLHLVCRLLLEKKKTRHSRLPRPRSTRNS